MSYKNYNLDNGGGGAALVSPGSTGGGGGSILRDGIEMIPLYKRDGSCPTTPRTPRRILNQSGVGSANQTPKKLQFSTPEVHTVPPSPISMGAPKMILTNRKR